MTLHPANIPFGNYPYWALARLNFSKCPCSAHLCIEAPLLGLPAPPPPTPWIVVLYRSARRVYRISRGECTALDGGCTAQTHRLRVLLDEPVAPDEEVVLLAQPQCGPQVQWQGLRAVSG